MIFLLKMPEEFTLCHKGTNKPISFRNWDAANLWMERNPLQGDYELVELSGWNGLRKSLKDRSDRKGFF